MCGAVEYHLLMVLYIFVFGYYEYFLSQVSGLESCLCHLLFILEELNHPLDVCPLPQ